MPLQCCSIGTQFCIKSTTHHKFSRECSETSKFSEIFQTLFCSINIPKLLYYIFPCLESTAVSTHKFTPQFQIKFHNPLVPPEKIISKKSYSPFKGAGLQLSFQIWRHSYASVSSVAATIGYHNARYGYYLLFVKSRTLHAS